jgi:hypothetical protein
MVWDLEMNTVRALVFWLVNPSFCFPSRGVSQISAEPVEVIVTCRSVSSDNLMRFLLLPALPSYALE